ncbi:TPA: hypothetical protein N0F65_012140 [Lagenidium giganteum]|uniref:Uncharacterized protein n=1 Tax=Lagenidium giganteum TaxID=4803 RepID=A0AAV2YIE3_9STRA|nr:TPA: hypothetical protein N0F65_012140 [Lagenidium giganteum]
MIATIFTMVFSCPCLWALIRWCREYDRRRRMVVVPEKKPKKRPDIALPKDKKDPRTQAQMLEAQRERVKKLENVQEKKLKPKSPKRKGPPTGPRKDTK